MAAVAMASSAAGRLHLTHRGATWASAVTQAAHVVRTDRVLRARRRGGLSLGLKNPIFQLTNRRAPRSRRARRRLRRRRRIRVNPPNLRRGQTHLDATPPRRRRRGTPKTNLIAL